MSLISDALKKAERDRRKAEADSAAVAVPPTAFPEPAAPKRASGGPAKSYALGGGAVLIIAVAAYFIFSGGNSTTNTPEIKVAQSLAPKAEPTTGTAELKPQNLKLEVAPPPPARRTVTEPPPTPAPMAKPAPVEAALPPPVVKAEPPPVTPALAPAFTAPPVVTSSKATPPLVPEPVVIPEPPKPVIAVVPAPAPAPIAVAQVPVLATLAPAPKPVVAQLETQNSKSETSTPAPLVARITAAPPPEAISPAPTPVVVQTPASPPVPAPVIAAITPAPKPAAPQLETPNSKPEASLSGPNPAAQTFVDQIVLGGVRLGGTQMILIKGSVYKPGDPVNADLKLKLISVQPHDITFADESGSQYHKRY